MNPQSLSAGSVPSAAARSRTPFPWIILVLFLLGAAGAVALGRSFIAPPEARALRQAVFSTPGEPWERQFQVTAGTLPVWIARTAVGFTDVDPRAQTALAALNCASVGVYRRSSGDADARETLLAARNALDRHHWEPLVLVIDGTCSVGVFLPKDFSRSSQIRACVVVLDDNQMVLVSARANIEPLLELANAIAEDEEISKGLDLSGLKGLGLPL